MSRYIGASEADILEATGQNNFQGMRVLSESVELRLVSAWWAGGPGSKIAVGWSSPDFLPPHDAQFRVGTVTMPTISLRHTVTEKINVFRELLAKLIRRRDPSMQSLKVNTWRYLRPMFPTENHTRLGSNAPVFVWPDGILGDRSLNRAVIKVHHAFGMQANRRPFITTRNSAIAVIERHVRRIHARRAHRARMETLMKVLHRTALPTNVKQKIYKEGMRDMPN